MLYLTVFIHTLLFCPITVVQATSFQRITILSGGARHDDERHPANCGKKSTIRSIAEKSVSFTASAASLTAKHSGRAAYYLIRPKHVYMQELFGLWRLDQQVEDSVSGESMECSANIELTDRYVIVQIEDDREERRPWKFTPARWPSQAKLEFRAAAFQFEDGSREPLVYKGVVQRKLAAKSILKLKGKIYRIERTGWRGNTLKLIPVGTFSARKRLRLEDDSIELFDDEDASEGENGLDDGADRSDVGGAAEESDVEDEDY